MSNTPVAYIIFNRPRHTRKTFEAIRAQQPTKLYIVADGPRPGYPSDAERCREVREVVENIDWPCEVKRNYADINLGLKQRVSTGLNWVFEQEEKAIILEDDCLPHRDFFTFCETLLERYEKNEKVWVITGNNFQDGHRRGNASYYFSKYPHCWGWATWRSAWQHYQGKLPFWPEWRLTKDWYQRMPDRIERNYWLNIFNKVVNNEFDSWAYPWLACVWYHGGLTATPNVNLVTNIGFGPEGTHTLSYDEIEGVAVHPLGLLTHPDRMEQDKRADKYTFENVFGGQSQRMTTKIMMFPTRVVRKIIKMVKGKFSNV